MGHRLVASVITLLGVAFIVVALVRLLPGDPARVIAGLQAGQEEVDRIRATLGLDRPLLVQYGLFLEDLVHGDMGESARTNNSVVSEILTRLPFTLELAFAGTAIGAAVGILMGVAAATRRATWVDHLTSTVAVIGVSIPVYWLGILLIILFAVNLQWLPAAGAEHLSSLILPSFTIGMFSVGLVSRMTRANLLDVLGQDYVRTAHAKGLTDRFVIYKHALRNAFIPVLTVIGLQFGTLLGGAVLTESVFAWPGIGRLLVDSIFARDFPMIQGIVLTYATMFVVVNVITDLLYTVVDPRVRLYG
ncbi:MAG: ABC transporter permease subunit [Streptosporangiales bacterium]|nr:ABC transporter permease subunit [Streptosporangiales bacterium]